MMNGRSLIGVADSRKEANTLIKKMCSEIVSGDTDYDVREF